MLHHALLVGAYNGRVHRRIHGQIAALGMPQQHHRAAPQARHGAHILARRMLCGHRVAKRHVEILFPTHERVVRAAERHRQSAARQQHGHGGELHLLFLAEMLVGCVHANAGKARIVSDGGVQLLRQARVGEAVMAALHMKIIGGQRLRHRSQRCVAELRGGQVANRAHRMAHVDAAQTSAECAGSCLDIGQSPHACRHVLIDERRQHQRVDGVERCVDAERAGLGTCIIDDIGRRAPPFRRGGAMLVVRSR